MDGLILRTLLRWNGSTLSIRLSMRTTGLALLSLPVALDYLPNLKAAGFLLDVEMTLLYHATSRSCHLLVFYQTCVNF